MVESLSRGLRVSVEFRTLFDKADAGHHGGENLELCQPEEKTPAPFNSPAAIEFSCQDGDNCIGQLKFGARLHKEFQKWSGVESLDHVPVELHRTKDAFLVELEPRMAIIIGVE